MTELMVRVKLGENELEVTGSEKVVKTLIDDYFSSIFEAFPQIAVMKKPSTTERIINEARKKVAERAKRTKEIEDLMKRLPILKNENFFRRPKMLGEIKKELQTRGWLHKSIMVQHIILNHPELGIKRIKDRKQYKFVKM
jgi:hypothetical protein